MVAEQREAGRELVVVALQRRDRQAEVRVAAHALVEDPEVEAAELGGGPLLEADREADREAEQGQAQGAGARRDPEGRSGGGVGGAVDAGCAGRARGVLGALGVRVRRHVVPGHALGPPSVLYC